LAANWKDLGEVKQKLWKKLHKAAADTKDKTESK
jgi:hypothetical protein